MKPIVVLRHIYFEGPGFLENLFTGFGVPTRLIAVDEGEKLPSGLEEMSALVLMGGPMSANDPLPWLEEEFSLVRRAARSGLPVLGHCLGAQITAKALGGTVQQNPVKEIGWFDVQVADNPAARALFGTVSSFTAFHWHGETFTIPEGAEPILSSARCPAQGFVKDKIVAFQCHMEVTPDMLPIWTEAYRDEISHPTHCVQGEAEMLRHASDRVARMQEVARPMYERWIQNAVRV